MAREDTGVCWWMWWDCRRQSKPAYSPELNPAEPVFEEVRRWVEGRVYGSVEEKR